MQMRFLAENFTIVGLAELLRLWSDGPWDSRSRYCVVTFDDGWLDNYLHALPVVRRHRIPATVFLPTTFVGTDRWYWPDQIAWLCSQAAWRDAKRRRQIGDSLRRGFPWLEAAALPARAENADALIERCKLQAPERIDAFVAAWAQQLEATLPRERQVINWTEAQDMSSAGFTFGSHSATHRILTRLAAHEARREIEDSWTALSAQRLSTVPVFCYPNGDWSADVARLVAAAGYAAAVTTEFGYEAQVPERRFGLRRIGVHDDVTRSPELFAFHLAGYNHAR
jgi:peptidoglycan/xylan/chitin deacetylase (PgdA/CDA1 family)